MKAPAAASKLTFDPAGIARGPSPGNGFLQVADAQLGNGDYFGLY
jgi:hypothetical protein